MFYSWFYNGVGNIGIAHSISRWRCITKMEARKGEINERTKAVRIYVYNDKG